MIHSIACASVGDVESRWHKSRHDWCDLVALTTLARLATQPRSTSHAIAVGVTQSHLMHWHDWWADLTGVGLSSSSLFSLSLIYVFSLLPWVVATTTSVTAIQPSFSPKLGPYPPQRLFSF
jgi:hypothetical protein